MLYIFDSAEKLIDILPQESLFDAKFREVLNGENTFAFTIPVGNEYVVEGNLVAFRDLDGYWQVFEIKRLVDLHGDGLTRTAFCEHIFYELLDDIVTDKRPSGSAIAALSGMLEGTRWQVGIVDDLGAANTSAYYISALEAVQKVAEAWKGELNWRCVISGGVITRYVDLRAMVGTDTGKQFIYSKDILNIEREVDSSSVVTALYGRGKGVETESGAYGRRLTFADVVAADKPAGQEWIGDDDALSRWGRNGRHRFDVFVDEEETDPEVLLQKTRDELARRKVPRVTYRLDVVSLEQLTGYEHEKVRKGDLVRVIDREFTPELVVSARVIDIERDPLDPANIKNTKVVLGSFAPTIVEATINTARRVNDMANRPFNTKWLDGKISVLQNEIENVQSCVFQTADDGILILDAPTYDQATKAMKLGGGIFAIANQKDGQGGWNWRTFGDGSGFTADLITAGMIDAGLVQIGSATTFEEGYDPSKTRPVGMAADSNCTGLWHFDGSLNSHKGLPVVFDGAFANSKWGQGLKVDADKTLKIPTADILHPEESSVNMLAYNLAGAPNGAVIFDLGDSDGNQAIKVGISSATGHEGELFIEDEAVQYAVAETSQADFAAGTLTGVVSNPTGDLTLAVEGTKFAATEDTQAEFEAGTLANTEYAGGLKLKYTPGALIYGSDVTAEGTVSSSAVVSGQLASYAFDDDTDSWWAGDSLTDPNPWARLDFGANPKTIRKLRVFGANNSRQVKDFNLKGSNSATTGWVELCAGTILRNNSWQDFVLTSFNSYRYYQFNILSWYQYTGPRVYEMEMMEATQTPGTYALSGTWEKEYNLAAVGVARSSTINWNETIPANTSIQVQAAIATDGVNYGSYATCTSGSAIPGITAGMDLSSAKMKIKVTLTTTDTSVTPSLNSLTSWVTSAYKTSGNRVHIYDISGVGIAELSQIAWDATLPTGTSVAVKAAISTDGGSSYGAFQTCTSGQAIPVLTANMDISNARLKIQGDLATSDYSATPKLNSLDISVSKAANIAYGTNKSELIGWDNIAIQWKTERLSLIINGAESAYIENPGQVTTLDTYAFIGSDKAGANQIGTVVDELRIDKIYQPIDKVNSWRIVDAPFYTSEEFKQWPGYVKVETDGLKVYDSESALRLLVGSWLRGALRKYGIKVINGEIYSSIVSTGDEDAKTFIRLISPNLLQMFSEVGGVSKKQLEMAAPDGGGGGGIDFYVDDVWAGTISGENTDLYITAPYGDVVLSSLDTLGSKDCLEDTENFGLVKLGARESPENRYVDEGIGTLNNGECRIEVDMIFMECIESNTEYSRWYIHLTPYAEVDLYVAEIGADYFIVKEKQNGVSSNMDFAWSLSAVRKDYAHLRFVTKE